MKPVNIPMPTALAVGTAIHKAIEAAGGIPMPARVVNIKPPKKRKEKPKAAANIIKAAREYKEAYKAVYHCDIRLTLQGKWIRIHGQDTGVSLKRLKELTAQLRNRT